MLSIGLGQKPGPFACKHARLKSLIWRQYEGTFFRSALALNAYTTPVALCFSMRLAEARRFRLDVSKTLPAMGLLCVEQFSFWETNPTGVFPCLLLPLILCVQRYTE